jgi:hypothetical protein
MASKKPTAKKQPFVIEPLNWVAPGSSNDESEKTGEDTKQGVPAKEAQG